MNLTPHFDYDMYVLLDMLPVMHVIFGIFVIDVIYVLKQNHQLMEVVLVTQFDFRIVKQNMPRASCISI